MLSLLDLIKQYGDARADWMAGGPNRVPEALDAVAARLLEIKSALGDGREADQLVGRVL